MIYQVKMSVTKKKHPSVKKKRSAFRGKAVSARADSNIAIGEAGDDNSAGIARRERQSVRAAKSATAAGVRLQKHLADRGISSRRKIETLITEQKIRIDGRIAILGDRVTPLSKISINGRPVRGHATPQYARVILYNKPEGEISTRDDPGKRTTVFNKLPKIKGARWIAIGRLDINTRGLLLFTNNGQLANQLMHPAFGLEREYLCRVFGKVDDDALNALMDGVELDGELVKFLQVKRQRGEGSNTWFSVIVGEGKYREVRRMWESVGCQVSRLMRVRYGTVTLPKNLRQGEWIELKSAEVSKLFDGVTPPDSETDNTESAVENKPNKKPSRSTRSDTQSKTRLTPRGRQSRSKGGQNRRSGSHSRRSG